MQEQKLVISVARIAVSSVGLSMFVFADAIFVSMNKSHRLNDVIDQQERPRHLRPHLPRESIHNRLGHLTLWRAYIVVMLCVHHYIASPATLFCVLWRTHFKIVNVFTRFFIESVVTSSPTIHPSVYISMVHHDNIYV